MPRNQRTPLVILGLLGMSKEEPRTGYELKKAIDTVISHFWAESHGQLYPALKRLAAERLIRPTARSEEGRKKVAYAITAQGKARLRDWLALPVEVSKPRDELILKLFFGSETDSEILIGHVEAYRTQAIAMLEQCRRWEAEASSHDQPFGRFHLITIRAGIAHAEAAVSWADDSIAELASMKGSPKRTTQKHR